MKLHSEGEIVFYTPVLDERGVPKRFAVKRMLKATIARLQPTMLEVRWVSSCGVQGETFFFFFSCLIFFAYRGGSVHSRDWLGCGRGYTTVARTFVFCPARETLSQSRVCARFRSVPVICLGSRS